MLSRSVEISVESSPSIAIPNKITELRRPSDEFLAIAYDLGVLGMETRSIRLIPLASQIPGSIDDILTSTRHYNVGACIDMQPFAQKFDDLLNLEEYVDTYVRGKSAMDYWNTYRPQIEARFRPLVGSGNELKSKMRARDISRLAEYTRRTLGAVEAGFEATGMVRELRSAESLQSTFDRKILIHSYSEPYTLNIFTGV